LLFQPSGIAFNGGKLVAAMKVAASGFRRSNERMQRHFNWRERMNDTPNIASTTTIVCHFSRPAIRSGEQRVVNAALQSCNRGRVILNCSWVGSDLAQVNVKSPLQSVSPYHE
jgi:hypothetical protein